METINVIIEQAENNYSAYLEGIDGIVTTGATVDEIKSNMHNAINALIEECKELGCEVPDALQHDYMLVFSMECNVQMQRDIERKLVEHLDASTGLLNDQVINCRNSKDCESCIRFPCLLIKQADKNRVLLDSIEKQLDNEQHG